MSKIDWHKVEIYCGEERAVPPDHAESNYRMAYESLIGKVPLNAQNVQRMRGEAKVEGQLVADADIMSVIADRTAV